MTALRFGHGSRLRSWVRWPRTRRWLVDTVFFVVSALLAVSLVRSQQQATSSTLAEYAAIAAAVVACLGLWWRRRWPTELAVVLGLLTCLTPGAQLPALICLGYVASRRPARQVVVAALVQLVATLTRYLNELFVASFTVEVYSTSERAGGTGAVNSVLLLIAVIAGGKYIRARRQLIESLRDRAERAVAEQQIRIDQARNSERARIAREMHDVLAHRVSLISLQASALQVSYRKKDDVVAESAATIRTSAHQALDDLREVVGVLRASEYEVSPLAPQPTHNEIRNLVDESVRAGMAVSLQEDLGGDIPANVGRAAYRVVQEGLTNARKHAPGTPVTVQVKALPSGLHLEIRNPRGVSSDPAPPIPGAKEGLVGLAERARLLGGRVEHGWTAEDEFRITAWLPW